MLIKASDLGVFSDLEGDAAKLAQSSISLDTAGSSHTGIQAMTIENLARCISRGLDLLAPELSRFSLAGVPQQALNCLAHCAQAFNTYSGTYLGHCSTAVCRRKRVDICQQVTEAGCVSAMAVASQQLTAIIEQQQVGCEADDKKIAALCCCLFNLWVGLAAATGALVGQTITPTVLPIAKLAATLLCSTPSSSMNHPTLRSGRGSSTSGSTSSPSSSRKAATTAAVASSSGSSSESDTQRFVTYAPELAATVGFVLSILVARGAAVRQVETALVAEVLSSPSVQVLLAANLGYVAKHLCSKQQDRAALSSRISSSSNTAGSGGSSSSIRSNSSSSGGGGGGSRSAQQQQPVVTTAAFYEHLLHSLGVPQQVELGSTVQEDRIVLETGLTAWSNLLEHWQPELERMTQLRSATTSTSRGNSSSGPTAPAALQQQQQQQPGCHAIRLSLTAGQAVSLLQTLAQLSTLEPDAAVMHDMLEIMLSLGPLILMLGEPAGVAAAYAAVMQPVVALLAPSLQHVAKVAGSSVCADGLNNKLAAFLIMMTVDTAVTAAVAGIDCEAVLTSQAAALVQQPGAFASAMEAALRTGCVSSGSDFNVQAPEMVKFVSQLVSIAQHQQEELAAAAAEQAAADPQLLPRLVSMLLSCLKCLMRLVGADQTRGVLNAWEVMNISMLLFDRVAGAAGRHDSTGAASSSSSSSNSSSSSSRGSNAAPHISTIRMALLVLVARGMCVIASNVQQVANRVAAAPEPAAAELMDFLAYAHLGRWVVRAKQLLQPLVASGAMGLPGAPGAPAAAAQALQQLQQQLAEFEQSYNDRAEALLWAAGATMRRSGCASDAERVRAAAHSVGELAQQLQAFGAAVCTQLPVHCSYCNCPGCTNMAQLSELELVGGKSCICAGCRTARYCSKQCQTAHWKQHRPVCRRFGAQKQPGTATPPPPAAAAAAVSGVRDVEGVADQGSSPSSASTSTASSSAGAPKEAGAPGAASQAAGTSSVTTAAALPSSAAEASGLSVKQLKVLLKQLGVPGAAAAIEKCDLVQLLVKRLGLAA